LHKAGKLDVKTATRMQAYGWEPAEFIAYVNANPKMTAQVNYTRTQDDYLSNLENYGRSFTSKRGEHIPNIHGETTNIADPLDAMAAELSNTAYIASHTEFFDVSIQRWFETAKPLLSSEMQKMTADKAFAAYMAKGKYVGQNSEEIFIYNTANQIAEAMKVNDKESRVMLGVMRSLTEWAEDLPGGTKLETVGAWMRQADVVSWSKAFSFYSYFGFNGVQFFVQGMNAMNAAILHPVHGLKAAKAYAFLRAARTSDNPKVWKFIAKVNKWTSLGFGSEDDFLRLVKAVDRVGIVQNLETSSLYGMQLGKHSLTKGWFGTVKSAAAFPFKEGEEAARLVSFDIARREWIDSNPGKIWDTDEALREIMARQDVLTGTMTNANATWWQKDIYSIPMQFLAFPIKFTLNIANGVAGKGRTFTRKEALTLIAGNFFVFGSAGLLNTNIGQSVFGDALKDMTQEEKLFLSQGILALSLNAVGHAFDEDIKLAVGDRFNPLTFIPDLVKTIANLQEVGLLETLGGAAGGAVNRFGKGLGQIIDLYTINPDLSPERAGAAVKALLQTTSVGNNYFTAERAQNLHNQLANGKYRATDGEIFFKKYLGIDPATSIDYRSTMESNIDYTKRMKQEAKRLTDLRIKAAAALNQGDFNTYLVYKDQADVIKSSMRMKDQQEVERQVKTLDVFTDQEIEMRKFLLENFNSSKDKKMLISEGK
jgi:hypothetical protein